MHAIRRWQYCPTQGLPSGASASASASAQHSSARVPEETLPLALDILVRFLRCMVPRCDWLFKQAHLFPLLPYNSNYPTHDDHE